MNDLTIECRTSRSRRSEAGGAARANRLAGEVRRVDALTVAERDRMYGLMSTYFERVSPESFSRDLAEKTWAVLLTDSESGRLCGFSTLMGMSVEVEGERVGGVFSGDTIVDREYWGETALARVWSQYAFRLAAAMPEGRVFWFLICSGYKTYRFLPVFFREFFPTFERPTPRRIQSVMDALASSKFPAEYHAERGIVRFETPAPLVGGVADVTEQRLGDPHVAFFVRANPGHADGDELVCLTELTPTNLTPAGRRMVGREIVGG